MGKEKNIFKGILNWVIIVAFLGGYFCYYYFDWSTTIGEINRYLDSLVKSVGLIAIASAVTKIVAAIAKSVTLKSKRGLTVARLVENIIKYVIAIIAAIICIGYFIEDTASLITGVSALTLVVGLGAQSLISDVVAGIFIVFEGSIQIDDMVDIDGFIGTVHEIGLRTTKIIDPSGNVQIVNNSKINYIVNKSKNLSIAGIDVGIEYKESIERVEKVLEEELPKIKEKMPTVIEGPYYKGVSALGDSAVMLKIIATCREEDRAQLTRDLNREIKLIFDNNNINIPFPQLNITQNK